MSANGGPAFPVICSNPSMKEILGFDGDILPPNSKTEYKGMTLLDWFAGQALVGMMANPNCVGKNGLFNESNFRTCYDAAATMLAEKAKREPKP
jgi:hypothetical protein